MSGVKSQEELDFEFALKMQEEERQHGKSSEELALEEQDLLLAKKMEEEELVKQYEQKYKIPLSATNPFLQPPQPQQPQPQHHHDFSGILNDDFAFQNLNLNQLSDEQIRYLTEQQLIQSQSLGDDIAQCPMCGELFGSAEIEQHVSVCLPPDDIDEEYMHQRVYIEHYDPVNKKPFECPICMDEVIIGSGYVFEKCKHNYCGSCLQDYYTQNINAAKTDIKCPDPTCENMCSYDDLKFILPKPVFVKYIDFARNNAINKNPNMRWCPNPAGCGNAMARQNENDPKIICSQCNYEYCFDCSDEYHPGKTCEEFKKWKMSHSKTDVRVALWQRFYTKLCPNCKAVIQKDGGCNHMTCERCSYEFCWQCMKEYEPGHYDRSRCSQYGTKVKLRWAKLIARRLVAKLKGEDYDSDYDSSDSEDEGRNRALETLGEIVHKVDDWGQETKLKIKDGFEEFKEQSTSFFKKIGSGFEKLKIKKNNDNNNNNAQNNNNNNNKKPSNVK
jgi:hypothetical protein